MKGWFAERASKAVQGGLDQALHDRFADESLDLATSRTFFWEVSRRSGSSRFFVSLICLGKTGPILGRRLIMLQPDSDGSELDRG